MMGTPYLCHQENIRKIMKTKNLLYLCLALAASVSCGSAPKQEQPVKVADYLWEITVNDYASTAPECLFGKVAVDFGCSAVRNGNFYGRNLDFFVNEKAEVVIHTPARNGRHAAIGVGLMNHMTDAQVAEGLTAEQISMLPWGMYDGINDAGLFCNMNVVDYADGGECTGTNPGKPEVHTAFLIRELLDNCGSVDEAIAYINSRNIICDIVGGFNLHFMIGDPGKNVVVEFINNEVVVRDHNIMTNFYVNMDALTPNADGVERYAILKEHYAEGGESMEGMHKLMKRVRYSQAYDPTVVPFWKSEFHENGRYSWDDPDEVILADPNVQAQFANFAHFRETGEYTLEMGLWFTTHNSVYDISGRKLRVTVRENYDRYFDFELYRRE